MSQARGDDSYHKGWPREDGGQGKCDPLYPHKIQGNSQQVGGGHPVVCCSLAR